MTDVADAVDGNRSSPARKVLATSTSEMQVIVRFAATEELDDVNRSADGERRELDIPVVLPLEGVCDPSKFCCGDLACLAIVTEKSH